MTEEASTTVETGTDELVIALTPVQLAALVVAIVLILWMRSRRRTG